MTKSVEMEVYVYDKINLGENEVWTFEKDTSDEDILSDWKVYQNIFVTEIKQVSFNRDKHTEGLLCKVSAYIMND